MPELCPRLQVFWSSDTDLLENTRPNCETRYSNPRVTGRPPLVAVFSGFDHRGCPFLRKGLGLFEIWLVVGDLAVLEQGEVRRPGLRSVAKRDGLEIAGDVSLLFFEPPHRVLVVIDNGTDFGASRTPVGNRDCFTSASRCFGALGCFGGALTATITTVTVAAATTVSIAIIVTRITRTPCKRTESASAESTSRLHYSTARILDSLSGLPCTTPAYHTFFVCMVFGISG